MKKELNTKCEEFEAPRIERLVELALPDGSKTTMNRFDFNLAFMSKAYVQLDNGTWINARRLAAPYQCSALQRLGDANG